MKGIVFNMLEEAVTKAHGEQTWEALVEQAGASGAWTALGNYPDEELFKIVEVAARALGLPVPAVVRWFGVQAAAMFAQRYPAFFAKHVDARSFLVTLNDVIHPEVRKLYPGASVPSFEFADLPDGGLAIRYISGKKLCSLAEGLIEGATAHYKQRASLEHPECMHRGAATCLLRVTFA